MTIQELCHAMGMECDNPNIAHHRVVVHINDCEYDVTGMIPSKIGRAVFVLTTNTYGKG